MAIQGNGAPSMAEQIASFKGASAEDGVVTSVQNGAPAGDALGDEGEDDGAQGERQQPGTPPARKRESAQDRIDKAVKKQRQAERELDTLKGSYTSLEQRLSAIEKGGLTKPTPQVDIPDPNAPDPSKFTYGELDKGYISALARYEATKIIEAEKQVGVRSKQSEAHAAQQQALADFLDKGEEKYPDFREKVYEDNSLHLTRTLGELALESEVGVDIMHAFANLDRKETLRISKMTEAQQARWFGVQEAKLTATSAANGDEQEQRQTSQRSTFVQPERTTRAPPPPERRVRAGGNVQPTAPDTPDFAAFERLAMQRH